MPIQEPTYWPFPVMPQERWSDLHWQEYHFLEEALRKEYQPCKFMEREYHIQSRNGRSAWVLYRGRTRRGVEVWLNDVDDRVFSTWVKDFPSASSIAFQWVDGENIENITAMIEQALPTPAMYAQTLNQGTDIPRLPIESTP